MTMLGENPTRLELETLGLLESIRRNLGDVREELLRPRERGGLDTLEELSWAAGEFADYDHKAIFHGLLVLNRNAFDVFLGFAPGSGTSQLSALTLPALSWIALPLRGSLVSLGAASAGTALVVPLHVAPEPAVGSLVESPTGLADGLALASGGDVVLGAGLLYNGASWDRARANVEGTALTSSASTGTRTSIDLTNHNARGVLVYLDITIVPGVDTVTLSIEGKDPTSGKYFAILSDVARSAVASAELRVYPGLTNVANAVQNAPLPRTWRVRVVHSAAGSFTYSVGFVLVV